MTAAELSWETIREQSEELLCERFLLRILQAPRPPLWVLLESAEHFFHAGELQRARSFLARAAELDFADPLLDELDAKVTWAGGDRDDGLRLVREAAARWQLPFLPHLERAMLAEDVPEIMEPGWRTALLKQDDQHDLLIATRLRLSGTGLDPAAVTAALGAEPDDSGPGWWALEALGSGYDANVQAAELLARLGHTGFPEDVPLTRAPGVELAVLEVLMIRRGTSGEKRNVCCTLEPTLLARLGALGIAVKMLG